ncbi:MAG: response regulator transcription factor [Spirochaetales bacterium]|nr:response regulator transcription factor [Spirochaetales bacterium]
MAKILIIEDEDKIAEVVSDYLKNNGHEPFVESNGIRGQNTFLENKFDLIILDLMLPDISGECLCRFIRRRSRVPVMMLTAKADEASLLYGFRIGADDYLTKPFSPRELMVRIDALLRRSRAEPAMQLIDFDMGDLKLDSGKRKLIKRGVELHLTPIEFDILEKLISSPGRIFTREDIIQSVMGYDFKGIDRTVDSHIRNLRSKIEDCPKAPSYVLTQRGKGFYFNG